MRCKAVIVLLISCYIKLQGQSDTIPLFNIDEVVIGENRIQIPVSLKPSSIALIDAKSANHMPVLSISELLHSISGVDVRQRAGNGVQNDIVIRGSTFDQVLILVNGIGLSDPQTGHHTMNLPFDLSSVDHIEVYKGPSARVFGQNAFAGAINIITKIPETDFIILQGSAGGFGLAGISGSVSYNGSNLRSFISVDYSRSDGYKYNTDFNISDIFYQSEIKTRYGLISFLGGFSKREFGANGFYSSPAFTEQYESVSTSLAAIELKPAIRNKMINISNRIYWRGNSDDYVLIRSDPSYYRNLHISSKVGVDFNMSLQSRIGVSGFGIDVSSPAISSNRLGSRRRSEVTLFAEQRFTLLRGSFDISPGVQVNIFSDFENNVLPGVDIGYKLLPSLMLYFNSGYTYRVPTFTDLYYEDPANSGNPYLQPEYAFSNELGFKTVNLKGLFFQFSCFSRESNNLIDRTKANENDKWSPQNLNSVSFRGVDMNLNLLMGELNNFDNPLINRLDLGYTYINSNFEGNLPAYSQFAFENLKNQLVIGVELRYFKNLYQTINVRYNDRTNMDNYVVSDSRLGWNSMAYKIFIDVNNIFNIEYKETNLVTMPGRWIKGGISYKFRYRKGLLK